MKTLFLLHPGTNSRDIFRDMIAGWRQAGIETIVWETSPHMAPIPGASNQDAIQHSSRMLAHMIQSNNIDLCIAMWANGLTLVPHGTIDNQPASFYRMVGCKHLMFWLDAPQWAAGGQLHALFGAPLLQDPSLISMINNTATAEEMRTVLKMGRVISSPYGINPEVFRTYHGQAREFDIIFAAGPGDRTPNAVMKEELTKDDPDTARIRDSVADEISPTLHAIATRFKQAGESAGKRLLEYLVEDQLQERHRPVLDRIRKTQSNGHEAAVSELLSDPKLYTEVTSIVRSIENWERAFMFAYLDKRFKCATMGQCDLSAWGVEATPFGMVDYTRMAELYSRANIGLNVMRWQDDIGLNIKPAEITASGTACLCAYRAGLDELWTESEIASFHSPAEAAERARMLLSDPSALESLASAGQDRTLRDHTWAKKAESIIEAVR